MSSSIKFFFYIALFASTLGAANIAQSGSSMYVNKSDQLEQTKILLTEKLLSLDFERLANRDSDWLEGLGANYDYDNQQYFLEFASEFTRKDSTILVLIDFAHIESVEVRIFAPEELGYVWLRCRLRATPEQLYISHLFHPQSNSSKTFKQTIPRNHVLAAALQTGLRP